MNKNVLFFYFILIASISHSQSKKEQIEILNLRIDSLNNIIINERTLNSTLVLDLNNQIDNQNNKLISEQIKNEKFKQDTYKKEKELESEINNLKKENQTLLIEIFHQKIIGTYNIPFSYGTCIPDYKLYIDENLKISFITTCLRPESKDEENVGTFELNKPIKFEGPYFYGFLFKENGFYLLDEEDNILSIPDCCENDSENSCECMISYTSKIID